VFNRIMARRKDPEPEMDIDGRAVDPTPNVLQLVDAAIKRQDDLRASEVRHSRDLFELRASYDDKLREAETKRIDAIRAVDVSAVQRAAEVGATQATTLAAQVATSAETLRNQVAAAATAAEVSLAAALVPIQEAINDLRRAQYEQAGQKSQVSESRLNYGAVLGGLSIVLVVVFGILGLVLAR
jgi:hypothetical protein